MNYVLKSELVAVAINDTGSVNTGFDVGLGSICVDNGKRCVGAKYAGIIG